MQKQAEKQAEELLEKLTLDEKIGMIHGAALFETAGVARLGIPPLKMSDGPMGVREEYEADSWNPIGQTDDYVTYLPCNSALASTWNRTLAYEAGSVLGEEARGRGKDVILAPGVNIKRSPLCGRNFEYFSEDPYLTAQLAVPFIKGVQNWDVAACIKHFAVNNQETERLWVDVEIDEKALREIYFPAFQDAVQKAGVCTVMGAYNRLYGKHCCQSDYLLRKILREEWGFKGLVISDWGAVHDTKEAAESELDIEMSVTNNFDEYYMAEPLKEKIKKGEIPESAIDRKVRRILMLMIRLHMLDGRRKSGAYNTPEHRQKALDVARESFVLLKNDTGKLPLAKEKLKRVLLIGENAACVHANGGGSAQIKALYEITPLMGLKTHLGGNTEVKWVPGYCRMEHADTAEENWQETSLENGGGRTGQENCTDQKLQRKQKKLREEAITSAKDSTYDAVIYIGGLSHDQDSEGIDRKDMKLPGEQDLLIRELLSVRPDSIIILTGGSPVEMGEWVDQTQTLLWGWYAGMEGGHALADILLGNVNPSGRLPETFYRSLKDCSAHAVGEFATKETVSYKEGCDIGYRYLQKHNIRAQFPFGYGLSYTTFTCQNVQYDRDAGLVSCRIRNTGDRDGAETVQVYGISEQEDGTSIRILCGFEKVFLKAGEEKEVQVAVCKPEGVCSYVIGRSVEEIREE